jgi:hypothetical protein
MKIHIQDETLSPGFNMAELEYRILKVLSYFDIFPYPLLKGRPIIFQTRK